MLEYLADVRGRCKASYYLISFLITVEICREGDIRLQDGGTATRGRVEICLGVWSRVCGTTGFEDSDATVVCRQLGFTSASAIASTHFPNGDRPFGITFVECNGNEGRLTNCPHRSDQSAIRATCNSLSSQSAGVSCGKGININFSVHVLIWWFVVQELVNVGN